MLRLWVMGCVLGMVACNASSESASTNGENNDSNATSSAGSGGSGGSGGRGGSGGSSGSSGETSSSSGGMPSGGSSSNTSSADTTSSSTGGGASTTGGTAVNGAECSGSTSCGGDVVGRWELSAMCMNEEELLVAAGLADYPGCSDVYESISYESTAATMEFTADGQVISSGQLATIIVLNMTDACLSDLSGQAASVDAAACAELEAGYNSDSSTTGTCVLSPGNCQCTVKAAAQDLSSADNYVLSGNQLVDTTGATIDYCVEGSTLRLGDELTTMVLSRVD